MSYSDFMRNWDNIQICHLSADSFSSEILEKDDVCFDNCPKYIFEKDKSKLPLIKRILT